MFNEFEFNEMLKTDIWLINNMLTLPSDPPPKRTEKNNIVQIMIQDTYSMNDQIKAVEKYRNNLIPAIFAITQKVYSELFRLLIGNNGVTAGWRQYDVELKVDQLTISTYSPFLNQQEFDYWWVAKFNYKVLRKARNQIMHNKYDYVRKELIVYDENGILLIHWKAEEVIEFAEELLMLVNRIK